MLSLIKPRHSGRGAESRRCAACVQRTEQTTQLNSPDPTCMSEASIAPPRSGAHARRLLYIGPLQPEPSSPQNLRARRVRRRQAARVLGKDTRMLIACLFPPGPPCTPDLCRKVSPVFMTEFVRMTKLARHSAERMPCSAELLLTSWTIRPQHPGHAPGSRASGGNRPDSRTTGRTCGLPGTRPSIAPVPMCGLLRRRDRWRAPATRRPRWACTPRRCPTNRTSQLPSPTNRTT